MCELLQDPITKVGPYAYEVERGPFENSWRHSNLASSGARAVLAHRGKRVAGIRLLEVKPWSFVRALGFRSGDVLTSVDDQRVDRLDTLLALGQSLQCGATIRMGLRRRDLPLTFTYTLR